MNSKKSKNKKGKKVTKTSESHAVVQNEGQEEKQIEQDNLDLKNQDPEISEEQKENEIEEQSTQPEITNIVQEEKKQDEINAYVNLEQQQGASDETKEKKEERENLNQEEPGQETTHGEKSQEGYQEKEHGTDEKIVHSENQETEPKQEEQNEQNLAYEEIRKENEGENVGAGNIEEKMNDDIQKKKDESYLESKEINETVETIPVLETQVTENQENIDSERKDENTNQNESEKVENSAIKTKNEEHHEQQDEQKEVIQDKPNGESKIHQEKQGEQKDEGKMIIKEDTNKNQENIQEKEEIQEEQKEVVQHELKRLHSFEEDYQQWKSGELEKILNLDVLAKLNGFEVELPEKVKDSFVNREIPSNKIHFYENLALQKFQKLKIIRLEKNKILERNTALIKSLRDLDAQIEETILKQKSSGLRKETKTTLEDLDQEFIKVQQYCREKIVLDKFIEQFIQDFDVFRNIFPLEVEKKVKKVTQNQQSLLQHLKKGASEITDFIKP